MAVIYLIYPAHFIQSYCRDSSQGLLELKLLFSQGKLMRALKWRYFHSKWNLLELAIILISWSTLSVFVKRTILGARDISYYQHHKDE